MLFKIVKDTQKSLRERCVPVEAPYSEEDKKLLKDMIEYLRKSQDDEYAEKHGIRSGVGLAAPQIGINKRMLAISYIHDEEGNRTEYGLINPRMVSNSVKLCYLSTGEGCLSVDVDQKGYVYRYNKITVKAFDVVSDKEIEIVARGYDAIVLQHELDHLDGVLYYDHINKKDPFEEKENSIRL